jgi:RES domain-containing protein
MTLDAFLQPLITVAFRHLPDGAKYDVLDFSHAGASSRNRWNVVGESTLYLAGDRGVAIAEFARHIDRDRPQTTRGEEVKRRLYHLTIHLAAVLDLRLPEVWDVLALKGPPGCFLDLDVARATARFVRVTTSAQAILVPSVAFLDDLTRGNVVVFLEKLPPDPSTFISACESDDTFTIGA